MTTTTTGAHCAAAVLQAARVHALLGTGSSEAAAPHSAPTLPAPLPALPPSSRDSIDREGADQEELDPEDWEGEGGSTGGGGDEDDE